MTNKLRAGLCVIGPGQGGRLVAAGWALETALSKGRAFGGRVVHISGAAAPSSALPADRVSAARVFMEAGRRVHAARLAVSTGLIAPPQNTVGFDAAELVADRNAAGRYMRLAGRAGLAAGAPASGALANGTLATGTDAHLKAIGVTRLEGHAVFTAPDTVMVGGQSVTARTFVLAPERRWHVPAIPGLGEIDYLTPDRPLNLSRPSETLAVIGFSGAALGLAQAHRRMGARVVVLGGDENEGDTEGFDSEVLARIDSCLNREGIVIRRDLRLVRVESRGREAELVAEGPGGEERFVVGQVLVAGRQEPLFAPVPDEPADDSEPSERDDGGLRAGLILCKNGVPICDSRLRTTNHRVFLIGGGPDPFSEALEWQASAIVGHALRRKYLRALPKVRMMPLEPQVAVVGASESEAQARNWRGLPFFASRRPVRVMRLPLPAAGILPKEVAAGGHTGGEVRLVVSPGGKVLGCTLIGEGAADQAGMWMLAVSNRMSVGEIAGAGMPDATGAAVSFAAARSYLHHPRFAGVVSLLRDFPFLLATLRRWFAR